MIVDVPNTAPYYQGNTTLTMPIKGLVSLDAVVEGFRDREGDSYTFSLETQPQPPLWFILNEATGVVSATMISGYQGNYTVNITAIDDCNNPIACGDRGWQLFDIIVPNREPYFQFSLSDPETIQLGVASSFQYSIASDTVVDLDGDPISWRAQLAAGDGLPVGMTFTAATRTLSGISAAGVYPITFIASDGFGGTVNQTLTLRVNSQPVANKSDVVIPLAGIHKPFAWTLPATAMIDADGDSLVYELVNNDPRFLIPAWLSFNGTMLSGIPDSNTHQHIPLLIRGRDPFGGVGRLPILLSIQNTPPLLQAGLPKPDTIQLGRDISIDYGIRSDAALDVDGDAITWSAQSADGGVLPVGLRFDSAVRSFSGLPVAGVYNITLIASDGYGGSINQTITLRVNSQPIVKRTDVLIPLSGVSQTFTWALPSGLMVDADGDAITYSLVLTNPEYIVPSWVIFNGTALSGTPTENTHQRVSLLFEGKDVYGGIGQVPVSLLIQNTPPRLQGSLPVPDVVQLGGDAEVAYTVQSGAAVDADSDAITWSASLTDGAALPEGLVFSSASRQLSGLPVAGVYNISFIASDGYGGFANGSITLRVNSQPVVNMVDTLIKFPGIHKPFAWTLPATAMMDADGDKVIYSLLHTSSEHIAPSWLNFNGTAFRGTPTSNNHQPISLLIEGRDPFGGVGRLPVTLSIENLSPVVQVLLASPNVLQVGDTFSYTFPADTFLDQESDDLQYRALTTTGTGSLPSFLSFDPVSRTLSGVSTGADAGRYKIVFQVDDGYGGITNSSVIDLHINTPPMAFSTPWRIDVLSVGQRFAVALPEDFVTDADGDELSYSLVRTDPQYLVPAWMSLEDSILSGTPLKNNHRPITVQLKAEDGFGGEAYRLVSLTIPNSAPTVSRALDTVTLFAGELKTHIIPGDAIIDADGDELLFSALMVNGSVVDSHVSLPEWVTHLVDINSFNLVPKSGDQGNYTVALTAVDTQGTTVQAQFNISIPNRMPVISIAYVDENLKALDILDSRIAGHFVDYDGDVLNYTVSKPDWMQYDRDSKTLSGLPPQSIASYKVLITADDGHGGQAHARFNVHVNPVSLQLSAAQIWQLVGYIGLASGLLVTASLFTLRRHRRIMQAEQSAWGIMRKWIASHRRGSMPGTSMVARIAVNYRTDIMEPIYALKEQLETLNTQSDSGMLKRAFQTIESAIKRYYSSVGGRDAAHITSMLVYSGFMDAALVATKTAITSQWPAALQRTLAEMLHYSARLIWLCHTGKGRQLDEMYKEELLIKLHELCDRLNPGVFARPGHVSEATVEVYHRLLSAREAMLSVQERFEWSGLALNVGKRLLSPVGMFEILRDFWRNAPQGWYLKLVILEQMVEELCQSPSERRVELTGEIQKQAMQETHWAFRYGLIILWQRLLTIVGAGETLKDQLTQGSKELLGKRHLEAEPGFRCGSRRGWISRHAQTLFSQEPTTIESTGAAASGVSGVVESASPRTRRLS